MRNLILPLTLAGSYLCAAPYGFSDYYFVDPDRIWHAEASYRWVAEADFRKHRHGHINYADGDAGLYLTQIIDDENSLTYGAGYDYLRLNWNKNPRFHQKNFNYVVGSLGFVSTTLERWRWIINTGFSVDAERLDFGPSAVYHGMLWGRYHFMDHLGIHVGALGWYGVENGRGFPIFGFDWRFDEKWSGNAIFPIDYSIDYAIDENWSIETAYASFGGPYKYPRRAHNGVKGFRDPIFFVYSNAVDFALKYKFEHLLRASLGVGWNFGGWVYIKNHESRHGKYYHFNSAPYAQGSIALTF
ncbi:MAG: hypothetical protein ABSA17_01440 [Rhabdochlamydiaceae bacterium]|jgi:hypothetical protein